MQNTHKNFLSFCLADERFEHAQWVTRKGFLLQHFLFVPFSLYLLKNEGPPQQLFLQTVLKNNKFLSQCLKHVLLLPFCLEAEFYLSFNISNLNNICIFLFCSASWNASIQPFRMAAISGRFLCFIQVRFSTSVKIVYHGSAWTLIMIVCSKHVD